MSEKRNVKQSDIEQLRKLLAGTNAGLFAPSDDGHVQSVQRWSRAAEKPAGVAFEPTSAEQVSIVVKYANDNGLDLAVKGGGHSTSGASSTDGGILVNLSRMRQVKVDADKKLLYIQGGALWGDVDAAAWEHGLATVGGTVADTGVGGLTLGGGYGHLTGTKGLVIDNMVSATVVLANGDIKNATREGSPDLFWALLGAGQNFGVTTEFVLKAYPQGEPYTGVLVFPPTPEVVEKIVATVNDLFTVEETPQGPRTKVDGKADVLFAIAKPPPAGGQTMILVICTHVGTEEEGKALFQPLIDIGPLDNSLKTMPFPAVNKMVPAPPGMRVSMKGAAFVLPLRADFVQEVIGNYDAFISDLADAGDSLVAWELMDPGRVVASDVGSFANRGYSLNALVMPAWHDAANDAGCRQWARDLAALFKRELEETHGKTAGKGVDGGVGVRGKKGAVMLYGNYDQYDEKSKDIFGDNYPRLQRIKAQYDPSNLFNKLFAIQPDASAS